MKTRISMSRQLFMLMAISTTLSFSALSQTEEGILNSDPINITGYEREALPPTDMELENVKQELQKQRNAITINKEKSKKFKELGRTTEKLSDVTEEMIGERKESKETIARYNKKIDCLMQEAPGKDCDEFIKNRKNDAVSTAQAAPVIEEKVEVAKKSDSVVEAIKILPYVGFLSHVGEKETLESTYNVGLNAEADISSRFSVGAGIGYNTLKTSDFAYSSNYYRNNYGPGWGNTFGNGREIEYSNLNFNVYTKFFLINSERFRPYIGLGAQYNRASMKFGDNSNYAYGSYRFGDEELNYSYMSANLMGGVEISFTQSIGLNVEVNYSRGISGNLSNDQKYNNLSYAPDQMRLRELRDELVDANTMGVNAALLIKF